MGSLAQEFQTYTRKIAAPEDAPSNPDAYGANIGKATQQLGQAIGKVADATEFWAKQEIAENEAEAGHDAKMYELEMNDFVVNKLPLMDHKEHRAAFDKESARLKGLYESKHKGSAARIFSEGVELGGSRQRVGMNKGYRSKQLTHRRGLLISDSEADVTMGGNAGPASYAEHDLAIEKRWDLAVEQNIIDRDEAELQKIRFKSRMRTTHESNRVNKAADELFGQMWAANRARHDGEDEGEVSDKKIIAMLDGAEAIVQEKAMRMYEHRVKFEAGLEAEGHRESFGEVYNRIAHHQGLDADGKPVEIPENLPPSYQKSLQAARDFYLKNRNKLIDTDFVVHENIMDTFQEDQAAFADIDLPTFRMHLSDGDYSWFEARQNAIRGGTVAADKRAYSGSIKMRISWLMTSYQGKHKHLNTVEERAAMHLELSEVLEAAQERRRVETKNPKYRLTEDEALKLGDKVLLKRKAEVRDGTPLPNKKKAFEDVTREDFDVMFNDATHDIRISLATEMGLESNNEEVDVAFEKYFLDRGAKL